MSDVLARQRRRELRGSILRTARLTYKDGAGVTLESIHHVAGRQWRTAEVEEETQYLVDLQYLTREAGKRDALDFEPPVVYRLTALGMKVLNGDHEDASIDVR